MAHTHSSRAHASAVSAPAGRSGWITFSGVMLIMAGCFNIISGIAAIQKSDYLANQVLFSNLKGWGWFFLAWGCLEIIAGIAVFGRATWAVLFGVTAAFINAIAQLSWAATYPVWAVSAMVIDVLVIYGLLVYGFHDD